MINTAAVIVTFNRLAKLKQTIKKSLQEDLEKIIIVNNNSTDGTREYLDSLNEERLIIKHLDENIGGAGGFNVGFEIAIDSTDTEWIVCYDDDAYPAKNAISNFKALELNNDISAIAASVYLPSGEISTMNKVRFNPFGSLQRFYKTFIKRESIYLDERYYSDNEIIDIDASTFVGFFIRKRVIEEIGLPRKELFIYADDLIYTLGMTQEGYRLLFDPSLRFIHDCDTLVNEQDVYDPIWKVYYTYRNRIEMYHVSSKWLYLPITLMQIPFWYNKNKHYENPELFKKLFSLAIRDGLKRDFSKKLDDILKIVNDSS